MNTATLKKNLVSLDLPKNSKFIVWLSHDVDRVYKNIFFSIYYAFKKKNFSHIQSLLKRVNTFWNFDKITKLEEKYQVKSTLFFLHETMKFNLLNPQSLVLSKGRYSLQDLKIISCIKELDKHGWEVGLHGSYNSYNNRELLLSEKKLLQSILRHPLLGIRQHYLNLSIPHTWEIQRSLGFTYDASFGLTKDIGFRDQIFYPFRPFNDNFIVFPLTIMDKPLFEKYQYPNRIWEECIKIIDDVESKKTILSILWHQCFFNVKELPHHIDIYEKIIKECKKRNALFCTGINIWQYIDS